MSCTRCSPLWNADSTANAATTAPGPTPTALPSLIRMSNQVVVYFDRLESGQHRPAGKVLITLLFDPRHGICPGLRLPAAYRSGDQDGNKWCAKCAARHAADGTAVA